MKIRTSFTAEERRTQRFAEALPSDFLCEPLRALRLCGEGNWGPMA